MYFQYRLNEEVNRCVSSAEWINEEVNRCISNADKMDQTVNWRVSNTDQMNQAVNRYVFKFQCDWTNQQHDQFPPYIGGN